MNNTPPQHWAGGLFSTTHRSFTVVSRNNIAERNAFVERLINATLTQTLSLQLMEWEWDAEWPEVDTDGCLTGRVVGPDPDYTVVDVVQGEDGKHHATAFHRGSVGSMAMCLTAKLEQRQQLDNTAAECLQHAMVSEVDIAEGPQGWIAVVGMQCRDASKLADMLRQIGRLE
jgi:hypothetical protein